MRREHRRFLVVDECIGAAIVNFAINFALARLAYRALPSLPLYGRTSIAADTIATAIVLPLLTALLVTPLVRLGVARGKLPPLERPPGAWRPRSLVARGVVLAAASLLLVAAPFVLALALVGPTRLPTASFVWLKGGFAAALAALVTPVAAWWALADASVSAPAS